MKIIIPMAGEGSRFVNAGFQHPKPFIEVDGKPMIKCVVDSLLQFQYEHIFLVRAEHLQTYNMRAIFPNLRYKIIPVYERTEGAALTVALAKELFTYDDSALIVNSDQLFTYDASTVDEINNSEADGCIWCFEGSGPKWSYVRVEDGLVKEVAEKKQISNIATGGMYYWKSFYNFLDCANRMIYANDRVNNEFYVAPVYNYMQPYHRTIIKMLDDIDQLGTPEDLKAYEDKIRLHRND